MGQIEKAVDLTSFYCDSHVLIDDKRTKIHNLHSFGTDENLIIEGIAGQGKSIFLRYLCTMECATGIYIPIFGELRRIQEKETIEEYISKTLKQYNIDASGDALSDFLDTGNVVLLLDAFDEVQDSCKLRVVGEIEHLALRHENLRIIITSRPDSGIAICPTFRVVKLSNLEGNEYEKVIRKISGTSEAADLLIKQIKQHEGEVHELLQTPLLVTLLVIRFKSYPVIPDQLSDFYEKLFELLLQRHDSTKPGYKRSRACAMNDTEYREAFEAFCFCSKRIGANQFKYPVAYETSKAALEDKQFKEDAQNFLTDIVKITCLIVKDGEEYRFIHKSVQEYYTATYIKSKPDVVLNKLYGQLFNFGTHWTYRQELAFLEEIDNYRFLKLGVLPYLCGFFGVSEDAFLAPPTKDQQEVVKSAILDSELILRHTKEAFEVMNVIMPAISIYAQRFVGGVNNYLYPPLFEAGALERVPKDNGRTYGTKTIREVMQFLKDPDRYAQSVETSADILTRALFETAEQAIAKIKAEEKSTNILYLGDAL